MEAIQNIIEGVKASPVASLVFTVIMGILVWFFKKGDSLLAENEKTTKAELKEYITQLSILESSLSLYLLDPSTSNRDRFFEKCGQCSYFLTDVLKRRLDGILENPDLSEVRIFLTDLQGEISSLREYKVRSDFSWDNQSVLGRGLILVSEVGRFVGAFIFAVLILIILMFLLGMLYTQWFNADNIYMQISAIFAVVTVLLSLIVLQIVSKTPLKRLSLRQAMISMGSSIVVIVSVLLIPSLSILLLAIQIFFLWKLMLSYNWTT